MYIHKCRPSGPFNTSWESVRNVQNNIQFKDHDVVATGYVKPDQFL